MSSKRYYIGSPHLAEISSELWDNVQNTEMAGAPTINLSAYPG